VKEGTLLWGGKSSNQVPQKLESCWPSKKKKEHAGGGPVRGGRYLEKKWQKKKNHGKS